MFTGIDHPAIACFDVVKQAEWYCRNFGMRVIASNGQTPPAMVIGYDKGLTGEAMIELMPVKDAGPDPATLVDPISVMALRREMSNTMRTFAKEILQQQERYANRFYQGYIVLNYARMLHDLVKGRPGSKREGATWAKANFGIEWSALIDRAWTGRPNPVVAVQELSDPVEFEATLRFVKAVLRESEAYVPSGPPVVRRI